MYNTVVAEPKAGESKASHVIKPGNPICIRLKSVGSRVMIRNVLVTSFNQLKGIIKERRLKRLAH